MFGNDFLVPSIAFTLPFVMSLCFLAINASSWNVRIQGNTFFVVIVGVLALFVGELLTRISFAKLRGRFGKANDVDYSSTVLLPKERETNVIIVAMLIVLAYYSRHVYRTAMLFREGGTPLLSAYRAADTPMSSVLKLGTVCSLSVAYFYTLAFLDSWINLGKRKSKYLVPVSLFLAISTLSSGRMEILYFVVSALAMAYTLYKRKTKWRRNFNLRVVRISVVSFVLFFAVFYLLGYLTGKSDRSSFFNIISLYAGSSVAALDRFLEGFSYDISNFGSETLHGLANVLQSFGITTNLTGNRVLEFVHLGTMPYRTNIYTSFRRLLNDYGYFGMILVQFLTGILYSVVYLKNKYNRYQNEKLGILLYAFLLRYLVFQVIDERVVLNICTTTTVVQIVVTLFLFRFVAEEQYDCK